MNATMEHSSRKITKVKAGPPPEARNLTLDEVEAIFTPTGITAPAECPADSTRQIPEPNELETRQATNINGEAQIQIIRNWEMKGLKTEYDIIIIATANPEEKERCGGCSIGAQWMRHYSVANMHDRACMLGRKDWVEIQKLSIAQSMGRLGSTHTSATYKSKVVLSSTDQTGTVQAGVSAAGKKRITWMGHSGFSLARYLGKNGWTGAEAVDTYAKIGLPMGKSAIIGGVYAGKGGQRGEPAKVTPDQHKILAAHLEAFRKAKALAKPEEGKAKEVKEAPKPQPVPTPAPVPSVDKPKKGSKADHEAKLAAAMTAKAANRKANKQEATKKAMATKASKK